MVLEQYFTNGSTTRRDQWPLRLIGSATNRSGHNRRRHCYPVALTTSSSKQPAWSTDESVIGLKIIQDQVGHDHASTTSIYTCVSSDYRTRTLRRALDQTIGAALGTKRRPA